jgi:tRNA threonylcarbamoyladenosine biosynthesis protein TsaB
MPRVLAIDTASAFGSIALLEDGKLLEEELIHSEEGFAHLLFDRLAALLGRHGWTHATPDCFAAASGPGSFTGVRIGLAAVKGLGEAAGRLVVAVSNLRALALFGSLPHRAAVLDARRGEVYAAVYDAALELVVPERVGPLPVWLETLEGGELEFISSGVEALAEAVQGTRFEGFARTEAPRALASAVARIAERDLTLGMGRDPAAIDANYVRRSDAELRWRDLGR